MPVSEHDHSDTLLPATPDGYEDPHEFRYSLPVLLVGILLLLFPSLFLFGNLLWYAQGPLALESLFGLETSGDGAFEFSVSMGLVLVFFASIGAVTVLHELVHGLVYRLLGYTVSYGVAPHLGAFYACAFHQFHTRRHDLLVGIAPLVVLDLLLAPLLFVPVPALAFSAFVALLFNTLGAVGDLYLLGHLLRMPAGTLLYDSDIRHSYVYYPSSS